MEFLQYYTKLHDHPKNGCLMKMLYGELNEFIVNDKDVIENIHTKNNISYIKNYTNV